MPPFVIQIRLPEGKDVEWNISSTSVSFSQLLEVITHLLHYRTVTAFQYEDEDGDRITVRTDDDVKAMISYFSSLVTNQPNDFTRAPFRIYPKVTKTSTERNVHDLRIETEPKPVLSVAEDVSGFQSRKRSGSDLQEILSERQINHQNLTYVETLGRGHIGVVYRALYKPTNQVMAVKIMPLDITTETQNQIMSELEILYRCNSPFIIAFYGAYFEENKIFICTEFMDGRSLDLYGKIPESILGRIAFAIVKGLNYLWSLKIMHRDIKPSNMLINSQGQAKLCDFGVSVQLINSIALSFVGTNAYMAPERIKGDEYGIHSEVWSLGISFLEMALGKFPYETHSATFSPKVLVRPIELLQSIINENSPVLPKEEFSETFCNFVDQCMQKIPRSRPTPDALMKHPFCQQYSDGNLQVIVDWISSHQEKILKSSTVLSHPIQII